MAKNTWGAKPEHWQQFKDMGLTGDLLPVVSNQEAKISPHSKMVGVGKTPSHYNGSGQAAGIPKWTDKTATEKEVDKWASNPDYGICIQTRNVRALDIDVDDEALASEIAAMVQDELLFAPIRSRSNSGKCLVAFRLKGSFPKRMVRVDNGLVEFLGNGQQFIAQGTHTSGVLYDWEWNGASDFPEVDVEAFEALWERIVKTFGKEDGEFRGGGDRKKGDHVDMDDDTAEFLYDNGLVLGQGKEGQLYIECPWSDGHSSDTGVAQTAYFPKGTRGYEQGHFHCLHASCAKRTDGDFEDALGVTVEMFEKLPALVDTETGEEKINMPFLDRNKSGEALPTVRNLNAILNIPQLTRMTVRYDVFRDEIMWAPYGKNSAWEALADEHVTELRLRFENLGFKPIGKELMRDCVFHVAKQNSFDSAIEWINDLKWDGVPRVDTFCSVYFGTEDNAYTRSVARYLWTGFAGRVLVPGIKADMVPILAGPQGARKSSAVAAIAPDEDFFSEISLHERDDNLARIMRGCLVGEVAELQGLRSRELEAIKAFIARRFEEWVPKFKEFSLKYGRRSMFVGTTNEDQFLADQTGNRRWLPMTVTQCDPDAIARDRLQLWAEGREMFLKHGVLYEEAETLANLEHEKFRSVDAWEDIVRRWLLSESLEFEDNKEHITNGEAEFLRNADILRGALAIAPNQMKRADEMRLGSVMQALGYEKVRRRIGNEHARVWVKVEKEKDK